MKLEELEEEIQLTTSFSDEEYIKIIQEVGFECDYCGKCCTSEFNDHVFLLDKDTEKIDPKFLRPAPYFEFCDNLGRFYVMGYALKTKQDGSCILYNKGRCQDYENRPSICRIFPYMLHREPDEKGNIEFRQIGGLSLHGLYHNEISKEECNKIVHFVKEYEIKFLTQKLEFILKIEDHFKKAHLKHNRHIYDKMIRKYKKGEEIEVYVFFKGRFEHSFL